MKAKISKVISIIVSISFLTNGVVFAQPQISPHPVVSGPSHIPIYIPEQYGKIEPANRQTGKQANSPTVILIKDAHCHYEAQKNISMILEILVRDYKIDLVAVEGAVGDVDLGRFGKPENAKAKEKAADIYVKKGIVTGPEYLRITKYNELPFGIYGIEDGGLYVKNFVSFRNTMSNRKETQLFIDELAGITNILKAKIYSKELLDFDNNVRSYNENKMSLSDYVTVLNNMENIAGEKYPNLDIIYRTIKTEEGIDFKKVEREREQLINYIEKNLPKEELERFVKNSLQYKLGKISSLNYYSFLNKYITASAVHLRRYIRLVKLQDKIDSEKLFKEIAVMEDSIKAKLFRNNIERPLDSLSKKIGILGKLFNLQLTRDSLRYFKDHKGEFSADSLLSFIRVQAPLNGIQVPALFNDDIFLRNIDAGIIPGDRFYEEAALRDEALVNNTLEKMEKEKKQTAVMITGGFHTDGIIKLLQEKNVSYTVITPKITKMQEDCPYLPLMMDERIKAGGAVSSGRNLAVPEMLGEKSSPMPGLEKLRAELRVEILGLIERVRTGKRDIETVEIKNLELTEEDKEIIRSAIKTRQITGTALAVLSIIIGERLAGAGTVPKTEKADDVSRIRDEEDPYADIKAVINFGEADRFGAYMAELQTAWIRMYGETEKRYDFYPPEEVKKRIAKMFVEEKIYRAGQYRTVSLEDKIIPFAEEMLAKNSFMTEEEYERFDELILRELAVMYQSPRLISELMNSSTWDAFRYFQNPKNEGMEPDFSKYPEPVNVRVYTLLKYAYLIRQRQGELFIDNLQNRGLMSRLLEMAEATHTVYFEENDKKIIGIKRDAQGRITSMFLGGYFGMTREELKKYFTESAYKSLWDNPRSKPKFTLNDLVPEFRLEFIRKVLAANKDIIEQNGLDSSFTEKDLAGYTALFKEGKMPVIINPLSQSWSNLLQQAKEFNDVEARNEYVFDLQKNAVIDTFIIQNTDSAMQVAAGTPVWENPIYQRMNLFWRIMDWHGFDDELINSAYLPAKDEAGRILGNIDEYGIGIGQIKKDGDIFNKIFSWSELFKLEDVNNENAQRKAELKKIMDDDKIDPKARKEAIIEFLCLYGLMDQNGSLDVKKLERDHIRRLIAPKGLYGRWTERYFQATYDVLRYVQLLEELNLDMQEAELLAPYTHNQGYYNPIIDGKTAPDSPLGMIQNKNNPFIGGTLRNINSRDELSDAQLTEFLTAEGLEKYKGRYAVAGSKKFKLNDLVKQEKREEFFRALGKDIDPDKTADPVYNPLIMNTLGDTWENLQGFADNLSTEEQRHAQKAFLLGKQTSAIAQVKLSERINKRRLASLLDWQIELNGMEEKLGIARDELLDILVMHAFWLTNPNAQWGGKKGWNNEYDRRMQILVRTTTDVMAGLRKGDFKTVSDAMAELKGELGKDLSIVNAVRGSLQSKNNVIPDEEEERTRTAVMERLAGQIRRLASIDNTDSRKKPIIMEFNKAAEEPDFARIKSRAISEGKFIEASSELIYLLGLKRVKCNRKMIYFDSAKAGGGFCSLNLACFNLTGINFSEAYLYGTNLQGANLQNADFRHAHIEKSTDLRGADLRGADFTGCAIDFRKMSLQGTKFRLSDIESLMEIEAVVGDYEKGVFGRREGAKNNLNWSQEKVREYLESKGAVFYDDNGNVVISYRMARHKTQIEASPLRGLAGRMKRGLDPAGMLAIRETRIKIEEHAERLGVNMEDLDKFTGELHTGAIWKHAGRLKKAEDSVTQIWLYLCSITTEVNEKELTEDEYLKDVDRILAALDIETKILMQEGIKFTEKAEAHFTVEDDAAFSTEDAFIFMAIAGFTSGVVQSGGIFFVGADKVPFEEVARRYGYTEVVREDRGRQSKFYQNKEGKDVIKVLYPGFGIVFGDKELACELAKAASGGKPASGRRPDPSAAIKRGKNGEVYEEIAQAKSYAFNRMETEGKSIFQETVKMFEEGEFRENLLERLETARNAGRISEEEFQNIFESINEIEQAIKKPDIYRFFQAAVWDSEGESGEDDYFLGYYRGLAENLMQYLAGGKNRSSLTAEYIFHETLEGRLKGTDTEKHRRARQIQELLFCENYTGGANMLGNRLRNFINKEARREKNYNNVFSRLTEEGREKYGRLLRQVFYSRYYNRLETELDEQNNENHIFGVIEHSLMLTDLITERRYKYPKYFEGIDVDALIIAALLHDFGKIDVYAFNAKLKGFSFSHDGETEEKDDFDKIDKKAQKVEAEPLLGSYKKARDREIYYNFRRLEKDSEGYLCSGGRCVMLGGKKLKVNNVTFKDSDEFRAGKMEFDIVIDTDIGRLIFKNIRYAFPNHEEKGAEIARKFGIRDPLIIEAIMYHGRLTALLQERIKAARDGRESKERLDKYNFLIEGRAESSLRALLELSMADWLAMAEDMGEGYGTSLRAGLYDEEAEKAVNEIISDIGAELAKKQPSFGSNVTAVVINDTLSDSEKLDRLTNYIIKFLQGLNADTAQDLVTAVKNKSKKLKTRITKGEDISKSDWAYFLLFSAQDRRHTVPLNVLTAIYNELAADTEKNIFAGFVWKEGLASSIEKAQADAVGGSFMVQKFVLGKMMGEMSSEVRVLFNERIPLVQGAEYDMYLGRLLDRIEQMVKADAETISILLEQAVNEWRILARGAYKNAAGEMGEGIPLCKQAFLITLSDSSIKKLENLLEADPSDKSKILGVLFRVSDNFTEFEEFINYVHVIYESSANLDNIGGLARVFKEYNLDFKWFIDAAFGLSGEYGRLIYLKSRIRQLYDCILTGNINEIEGLIWSIENTQGLDTQERIWLGPVVQRRETTNKKEAKEVDALDIGKGIIYEYKLKLGWAHLADQLFGIKIEPSIGILKPRELKGVSHLDIANSKGIVRVNEQGRRLEGEQNETDININTLEYIVKYEDETSDIVGDLINYSERDDFKEGVKIERQGEDGILIRTDFRTLGELMIANIQKAYTEYLHRLIRADLDRATRTTKPALNDSDINAVFEQLGIRHRSDRIMAVLLLKKAQQEGEDVFNVSNVVNYLELFVRDIDGRKRIILPYTRDYVFLNNEGFQQDIQRAEEYIRKLIAESRNIRIVISIQNSQIDNLKDKKSVCAEFSRREKLDRYLIRYNRMLDAAQFAGFQREELHLKPMTLAGIKIAMARKAKKERDSRFKAFIEQISQDEEGAVMYKGKETARGDAKFVRDALAGQKIEASDEEIKMLTDLISFIDQPFFYCTLEEMKERERNIKPETKSSLTAEIQKIMAAESPLARNELLEDLIIREGHLDVTAVLADISAERMSMIKSKDDVEKYWRAGEKKEEGKALNASEESLVRELEKKIAEIKLCMQDANPYTQWTKLILSHAVNPALYEAAQFAVTFGVSREKSKNNMEQLIKLLLEEFFASFPENTFSDEGKQIFTEQFFVELSDYYRLLQVRHGGDKYGESHATDPCALYCIINDQGVMTNPYDQDTTLQSRKEYLRSLNTEQRRKELTDDIRAEMLDKFMPQEELVAVIAGMDEETIDSLFTDNADIFDLINCIKEKNEQLLQYLNFKSDTGKLLLGVLGKIFGFKRGASWKDSLMGSREGIFTYMGRTLPEFYGAIVIRIPSGALERDRRAYYFTEDRIWGLPKYRMTDLCKTARFVPWSEKDSEVMNMEDARIYQTARAMVDIMRANLSLGQYSLQSAVSQRASRQAIRDFIRKRGTSVTDIELGGMPEGHYYAPKCVEEEGFTFAVTAVQGMSAADNFNETVEYLEYGIIKETARYINSLQKEDKLIQKITINKKDIFFPKEQVKELNWQMAVKEINLDNLLEFFKGGAEILIMYTDGTTERPKVPFLTADLRQNDMLSRIRRFVSARNRFREDCVKEGKSGRELLIEEYLREFVGAHAGSQTAEKVFDLLFKVDREGMVTYEVDMEGRHIFTVHRDDINPGKILGLIRDTYKDDEQIQDIFKKVNVEGGRIVGKRSLTQPESHRLLEELMAYVNMFVLGANFRESILKLSRLSDPQIKLIAANADQSKELKEDHRQAFNYMLNTLAEKGLMEAVFPEVKIDRDLIESLNLGYRMAEFFGQKSYLVAIAVLLSHLKDEYSGIDAKKQSALLWGAKETDLELLLAVDLSLENMKRLFYSARMYNFLDAELLTGTKINQNEFGAALLLAYSKLPDKDYERILKDYGFKDEERIGTLIYFIKDADFREMINNADFGRTSIEEPIEEDIVVREGVRDIYELGDLHGAYGVLVGSLQSAGLINNRGEWIAGQGTHLVQAGDFIDIKLDKEEFKGIDSTETFIQNFSGVYGKDLAEELRERLTQTDLMADIVRENGEDISFSERLFAFASAFLSFKTMTKLMEIQEGAKRKGSGVTVLMGNHEIDLLAFRDSRWEYYPLQKFYIYKLMGINGSYNITETKETGFSIELGGEIKDVVGKTQNGTIFSEEPANPYIKWLINLPLAARVNNRFIIHGGPAMKAMAELEKAGVRDIRGLNDIFKKSKRQGFASGLFEEGQSLFSPDKMEQGTKFSFNELLILRFLMLVNSDYLDAGHDPFISWNTKTVDTSLPQNQRIISDVVRVGNDRLITKLDFDAKRIGSGKILHVVQNGEEPKIEVIDTEGERRSMLEKGESPDMPHMPVAVFKRGIKLINKALENTSACLLETVKVRQAGAEASAKPADLDDVKRRFAGDGFIVDSVPAKKAAAYFRGDEGAEEELERAIRNLLKNPKLRERVPEGKGDEIVQELLKVFGISGAEKKPETKAEEKPKEVPAAAKTEKKPRTRKREKISGEKADYIYRMNLLCMKEKTRVFTETELGDFVIRKLSVQRELYVAYINELINRADALNKKLTQIGELEIRKAKGTVKQLDDMIDLRKRILDKISKKEKPLFDNPEKVTDDVRCLMDVLSGLDNPSVLIAYDPIGVRRDVLKETVVCRGLSYLEYTDGKKLVLFNMAEADKYVSLTDLVVRFIYEEGIPEAAKRNIDIYYSEGNTTDDMLAMYVLRNRREFIKGEKGFDKYTLRTIQKVSQAARFLSYREEGVERSMFNESSFKVIAIHFILLAMEHQGASFEEKQEAVKTLFRADIKRYSDIPKKLQQYYKAQLSFLNDSDKLFMKIAGQGRIKADSNVVGVSSPGGYVHNISIYNYIFQAGRNSDIYARVSVVAKETFVPGETEDAFYCGIRKHLNEISFVPLREYERTFTKEMVGQLNRLEIKYRVDARMKEAEKKNAAAKREDIEDIVYLEVMQKPWFGNLMTTLFSPRAGFSVIPLEEIIALVNRIIDEQKEEEMRPAWYWRNPSPDKKVREALLKIQQAVTPEEKVIAIRDASDYYSADILKELCEMVSDSSTMAKITIAGGIARILLKNTKEVIDRDGITGKETEEAVKTLLKMLKDTADARVPWSAGLALARILENVRYKGRDVLINETDTLFTPSLRIILNDIGIMLKSKSEKDLTLAGGILQGLINNKFVNVNGLKKEYLTGIINNLRQTIADLSKEPGIRAVSINILAGFKDNADIGLLRTCLMDTHAGVRETALLVLLDSGGNTAREAAGICRNDEDKYVKLTAMAYINKEELTAVSEKDDPEQKARYAGSMLGVGIGDAMGAPFEGFTYEEIREKYDVGEVRERIYAARSYGRRMPWEAELGAGEGTDDIDMTLEMAESIAGEGIFIPQRAARSLANRIIRLDRDGNTSIGYSIFTLDALREVFGGKNWRFQEAVREKMAGNDGAIRSAPLSLLLHNNTELLGQILYDSAKIANYNKNSIAGTLAQGYVIARAVNLPKELSVKDRKQLVVDTINFVCTFEDIKDTLVVRNLEKILFYLDEEYLEKTTDEDVCRDIRTTFRTYGAEGTVPVAIFLFLYTPHDFRRTMENAVFNIGGDTDCLGSMAGAISGAYNGIGKIPSDWIEGLADRNRIIRMARAVYHASVNPVKDRILTDSFGSQASADIAVLSGRLNIGREELEEILNEDEDRLASALVSLLNADGGVTEDEIDVVIKEADKVEEVFIQSNIAGDTSEIALMKEKIAMFLARRELEKPKTPEFVDKLKEALKGDMAKRAGVNEDMIDGLIDDIYKYDQYDVYFGLMLDGIRTLFGITENDKDADRYLRMLDTYVHAKSQFKVTDEKFVTSGDEIYNVLLAYRNTNRLGAEDEGAKGLLSVIAGIAAEYIDNPESFLSRFGDENKKRLVEQGLEALINRKGLRHKPEIDIPADTGMNRIERAKRGIDKFWELAGGETTWQEGMPLVVDAKLLSGDMRDSAIWLFKQAASNRQLYILSATPEVRQWLETEKIEFKEGHPKDAGTVVAMLAEGTKVTLPANHRVIIGKAVEADMMLMSRMAGILSEETVSKEKMENLFKAYYGVESLGDLTNDEIKQAVDDILSAIAQGAVFIIKLPPISPFIKAYYNTLKNAEDLTGTAA